MKPLWQQQRRKRHETGNSSINDFLTVRSLSWIVLCILPLMATPSKAQTAQTAQGEETVQSRQLKRQKAGAPSREEEKLRQVGDGFEAMMLDMLYRQMQESNALFEGGENNPFAPSGAEKIYRSMRDEAMVKQLAGMRPLGYGDMALRQLKGESGVPRGALIKSKKHTPSKTESAMSPGG